MKFLTFLLFVLCLINHRIIHSQNNLIDSTKVDEILKKIDALNTKFDDAINSKDCDKQKSKIEKEIGKKSDTIRTLRKENSTLIANYKSLQKTDSIRKNELLKLKEDQIQDKSSISSLEKNKIELEIYKSSAEKYKESKEKQIETIRKHLKSSIETSKKIDLSYTNAIKILLADDLNSKELITQLTEFMDNQKKLTEIDSLMRIKTFVDFKNTKNKIELIKPNPIFKGQIQFHSDLKLNLDYLVMLIEKYRKWHEELNIEKEDLKFTFKFQDKLISDRNITSVNELFSNYPCLNYQIDRVLEKRKDYKLPSTN